MIKTRKKPAAVRPPTVTPPRVDADDEITIQLPNTSITIKLHPADKAMVQTAAKRFGKSVGEMARDIFCAGLLQLSHEIGDVLGVANGLEALAREFKANPNAHTTSLIAISLKRAS